MVTEIAPETDNVVCRAEEGVVGVIILSPGETCIGFPSSRCSVSQSGKPPRSRVIRGPTKISRIVSTHPDNKEGRGVKMTMQLAISAFEFSNEKGVLCAA